MKIAKSAYSKDEAKGNRKVKPILTSRAQKTTMILEHALRRFPPSSCALFRLMPTVPSTALPCQIMDGTLALYVKPSTGTTGLKKLFRGLDLTDNCEAKDNLIKELGQGCSIGRLHGCTITSQKSFGVGQRQRTLPRNCSCMRWRMKPTMRHTRLLSSKRFANAVARTSSLTDLK